MQSNRKKSEEYSFIYLSVDASTDKLKNASECIFFNPRRLCYCFELIISHQSGAEDSKNIFFKSTFKQKWEQLAVASSGSYSTCQVDWRNPLGVVKFKIWQHQVAKFHAAAVIFAFQSIAWVCSRGITTSNVGMSTLLLSDDVLSNSLYTSFNW